MGKLSTPDWIREGYDSKSEWEKAHGLTPEKKTSSAKKIKKKTPKKSSGKVYKIRKCPECGSAEVSVVLVGKEGQKADNWQCAKCKWVGRDVQIEEVSEDEFLKLGGDE